LERGEVGLAANMAVSLQTRETRTAQSAILRCIAGNPHRPVELSPGPAIKCKRCDGDGWACTDNGWGARDRCKVCRGKGTLDLYVPCPWVTPDGLSIAQATYEERPVRVCPDCKGRKKLKWPLQRGEGEFEADCQRCHGVGRVDDGLLDQARLAVLADAIEEAGCGNADLLAHLRGKTVCLASKCKLIPGQSGGRYDCAKYGCGRCGGTGWESLTGSHFRGCWAVDAILQRR
jgi:hypothetical protein